MTQLEQATGKYVIENTEIFVPVYTNIHYTHTSTALPFLPSIATS